MRHFHFPLNLLLLLAASLLTAPVIPVSAQTGNQSDATNPGLSNFSTVFPMQQTTPEFRGDTVQTGVNQSAVSLVTSLRENSLTASNGDPISPVTQQEILNILFGGEQSNISLDSVTNALSNAAGAPPLTMIQGLLSKLEELIECKNLTEGCTEVKVTAPKLLIAVRAYNAMIRASNVEFLREPPAELLAIQASLAKLIVASR